VVAVIPASDSRYELRQEGSSRARATLRGLALIEHPVEGGYEVIVHPVTTKRVLSADELPTWHRIERFQ
jgi:hypothetical protein